MKVLVGLRDFAHGVYRQESGRVGGFPDHVVTILVTILSALRKRIYGSMGLNPVLPGASIAARKKLDTYGS